MEHNLLASKKGLYKTGLFILIKFSVSCYELSKNGKGETRECNVGLASVLN